MSDELRHELARVLFNCVTLLSIWEKTGIHAVPAAIRDQIDECNDALRKIGCGELADVGTPQRARAGAQGT